LYCYKGIFIFPKEAARELGLSVSLEFVQLEIPPFEIDKDVHQELCRLLHRDYRVMGVQVPVYSEVGEGPFSEHIGTGEAKKIAYHSVAIPGVGKT